MMTTRDQSMAFVMRNSKKVGKQSPLLMLFLVLFILLAGTTMFGQTAQITGRISDQSGAVVVGAEVVVTNQQTGLTRSTVSNSEGYYTVLYLLPGQYQMDVKNQGFRPVVRRDIILAVDQVARLDFSLLPGAVSDAITVTADAPLLNSETASVGQVIENQTVTTLPLNGRNFTQLVALTPGSTPNPGSRSKDAVQLNGQRLSQTTYLIDGMDNNNPLIAFESGETQAVLPPVDAIQEFRVESSNYSAEYGRASGGVVNVDIKSGTNHVHGTAFEFFRNNALDANDYFANRNGLARAPFHFNQFGGTVGGPIVKNKLFLFGSYQGTLTREKRTQVTTVPTPDEKKGIFPFPVYDPLTFSFSTFTRQPFANNTIPQDRWDAVGGKLLQLYPDPNQPGLTNNYAGVIPTSIDKHQVDVRGDYVLGQKDSLFARYSYGHFNNEQGSLFGGPGYGGNTIIADQPATTFSTVWSVAGGYNHIFTTTLANELRLGYTRKSFDAKTPSTTSLYSEYGILGVPNSDKIVGLPSFLVIGYSMLGDALFAPRPNTGGILHLSDNVTWTRGKHVVRFGGNARWQSQTKDESAPGTAASRGYYIYAGLFSGPALGVLGSSIADLLLGQTYYTTVSKGANQDIRNWNYGLYFNDTWKVTPKLTLNLGLRYELQSPAWQVDQQVANFDLNPGSSTYGTLVTAKDGGIRDRSFINLDTNNFAPRVGLAYQLNSKTVVRAGAGLFYGGLTNQPDNTLPGNPPFNVTATTPQTFPNCLIFSCAPLQAGLPPNFVDPANTANPSYYFFPENRPIAQTYQWNLSVQRELPGNFALTAGYVGSGSQNLQGLYNANQPLLGTTTKPFPAIGGPILAYSSYAHATYHALQLKGERHFSNGLGVLSSYTWGHAIDGIASTEDYTLNVGPQYSYDVSLEKASSDIDLQQRWVTSVIYDLPIGRENHLGGNNAVSRAILGGWQTGGIFVTQTGLPFTVVTSVNPAGNVLRPNQVGNPVPTSGQTVDHWFNPSAYAIPAAGTIGNTGRNSLRAPGMTNLDLLVSRSFRLSESKRIDFRAEFFNALNTPHFGAPNNTVDQATAGTITTLTTPPRQIQLGLKFVF